MSKEINIQDEVMKIHHKYGTSEKANYEIQLLCERYAESVNMKKTIEDDNLVDLFKKCVNCNGTGQVFNDKVTAGQSLCMVCYGTGWVNNPVIIYSSRYSPPDQKED